MSRFAEGRIQGEIESSRPLRAKDGHVSVTGWCFDKTLPEAPPVRLVTPVGMLAMTSRLDRADVPRLFPDNPSARRCGFVIEGTLPAGVYLASFEALADDGTWRCFQRLSLMVEEPPFIAVIDEPIAAGILRDRVRVGGWALHPGAPLAELVLRYGHREIPCVSGRARPEIPAQFPGVTHAASSGFESRDYLVAGHGPVRARGRLASGRTVIANTKLVFSIATDENHGPELDLTAPRAALPYEKKGTAAAPVPTARPLNILFILHGDFGSNSALHVAALANELAAAGHACAAAVPQGIETLSHHTQPAFRGLTFAEANESLAFPDGRGPDLIHAWTTRENVRRLTQTLSERHHAKVVVHLEDNEMEVLALTLGRNVSELEKLTPNELDRSIPGDLSHPIRAREFLTASNGITVITEKLREFVPVGHPCVTLHPAADERYFFSRPIPTDFRRALNLPPNATVLFYHGNVHASNAAEVRELYAAVLQLNREGLPAILIRAGLDRWDFLGSLSEKVVPFVLNLGQILHHYLPSLMALADIFVQPGKPDAFNDYRFPSKLPEFFSIGRPVVLPRTNLGASVRHGIDAYVLDNADATGIARAIHELRSDRALYDRLATGAAAFAAGHFNWRNTAEALAKFYAELTA